MIEALIRDDKRLICLICIRPGPDKDSLNCDIFIPGKGQTLSGVMPAGGEPAQQVARAIMTVYPISALPTDAYQVALEKRRKEMVERENALHEGKLVDSSPPDLRPASQIAAEPTPPEPGLESDHSEDERWAALRKKDLELDEREKKLDQDIKNLRKSHPETD